MSDLRSPIGDPYFFDVPILISHLENLFELSPEDFDQYINGEYAPEMIGRIIKILQFVDHKQIGREPTFKIQGEGE